MNREATTITVWPRNLIHYLRIKTSPVFTSAITCSIHVHQTVGILMGRKCNPLLVDIFLYSHWAEFIQSLISRGKKQLASRFNLTFRYIDVVKSLNNPEFENYLGHMCPAVLEIKDTSLHGSSLPLLTYIYFCRFGGMSTSHFYLRKKRWFQFPHHKLSIPE